VQHLVGLSPHMLIVIFLSVMLARSKMLVSTPIVADTTHNIHHKELFHMNTSYKHVSSRLPQMKLYSNRKLTIRYLLGCLQEHLHSNAFKHNMPVHYTCHMASNTEVGMNRTAGEYREVSCNGHCADVEAPVYGTSCHGLCTATKYKCKTGTIKTCHDCYFSNSPITSE